MSGERVSSLARSLLSASSSRQHSPAMLASTRALRQLARQRPLNSLPRRTFTTAAPRLATAQRAPDDFAYGTNASYSEAMYASWQKASLTLHSLGTLLHSSSDAGRCAHSLLVSGSRLASAKDGSANAIGTGPAGVSLAAQRRYLSSRK